MSYYVPLPAYNPGPGINFDPLNQALDGVLRQNNANRQFGLDQRTADRADQQLAIEKRNSDIASHDAMVRQSAGIAQAALNERDPAKKAAMMTQLYGLHPEYKDRLVSAGIDPANYDGTANFIVSEARGYLDPQAVQLRNLQMDEAKANIAKTNTEIAAARRQADMFNALFTSELSGGGGPTAPSSNALAPAPTAAQEPVNNALMMLPGGRSQALAAASGPQNSLAPRFPSAPMSTDVPASVPQAPLPTPIGNGTQGIAANSGSSVNNSPSAALPQPGDPTSFTGDSASGLSTPSRISADTRRAMAYDLALNGGKGMPTILNNDPGSKYATAYAVKTAEDNAGLNLKQKMTKPLLAQIAHMRQIATDAGSDVLSKATGPDYSEGMEGSWLPGFMHPDTSGQNYQNTRALLQHANPFSNQASYTEAANVNLQMQHIKKMLGAAVKALPGTKGGGASTDQDQALVLDAVGEALHAQDPETFFKILHDAENGLRARAGMPPIAEPKSYLPESWPDSKAASNAGKQGSSAPQAISDALAGARDAISKGANPAAVRQRLIQNGINPDGL
ncbi:MAG: hypothetical protein QM780_06800 [Hyphomicrobium sp.]|uniref:hypothetical protein n=1 Tax=Hyphomicrobium sp. TaxID=82 RepID=UPI0039E68526